MVRAARGARERAGRAEPIENAGLRAALRARARGILLRTAAVVVAGALALALLP